jgi:transposase
MADAKTWAKRVSEWRASGESATSFAAGRGFVPSTLRWWASRLSRRDVGLVRVVTSSAVVSTPIAIEVAGARVLVTAGFDRTTLAEVVAVLLEARS